MFRQIDEFKLVELCGMCPEDYDVFVNGRQVAYFRLRHGHFTAVVPDIGGKLIYEAYPKGNGVFEPNERMYFLTEAIRRLKKELVA